MMKKATASVASLVALQLVIHLGASGGQVIAADAISSGGADSSALALYTCAGSALCLLLGAWARERALLAHGVQRALTDRDTALALGGLGLNFTLKSLASMHALGMTSALNAAVYIPLIPVCAAIESRLLGWERLSRRQYAGIALSIAGALIVTVGEYDGAQSSASAGRALLGNALLLVWMVTAANAIVLQRPLLRRPWFSSLTLSALVLGIAALLLALVTVPWITAAGGAGALALRSSLARGAACYCVAYYVLVNWGDAYMVSLSLPPSTVALGLTLEPLFTALLEWACFHDVMTLGQVAGAACTCLGLVVVVADLRAPGADDDEGGGLANSKADAAGDLRTADETEPLSRGETF